MRKVEIDKNSGFCFGVRKAIESATNLLDNGDKVYCVGDIVHNEEESNRLASKGMEIIGKEDISTIKDGTILFRAHGEEPASYLKVKKSELILNDATCPVVLKLQQRIRAAYEQQKKVNGQIIIFGKKGHAEVVGLVGQTNGEAIVVENSEGLKLIDFSRPIEIFAQTTKNPDELKQLVALISDKAKKPVQWHNTTCKQVTGRVPRIKAFASQFDIVVFVGGKKSSNAKVLFQACKEENENSYFVSSADELKKEWFHTSDQSVGVCGATSTPFWLMEKVAEKISQF